ncbi:MAG TPA: ATP-binding cassette domain-containing protein [Planctomycetota bacterium]|nr:ATP-binding cassette domain-containing protein [Planctomycetota bacterium]
MANEICDGRMPEREPHIEVRGLELGYKGRPILSNMDFTVGRGDVFVIMGGSGCGKSTLLRAMVGLLEPLAGDVSYDGMNFTRAERSERSEMLRRFGVLYQKGALWSSMTLAENIGLVLGEYTELERDEIREIAAFKLALVGLAGFEDHMPGEISGGMQKRAGIARAMALDPEILFLDEPSAGLDPITSRRLDELILTLRESLGTTLVVVTHDLESLLTIGDNSVFLDRETKSILARGDPRDLLEHCTHPQVQAFLRRGDEPSKAGAKETVS